MCFEKTKLAIRRIFWAIILVVSCCMVLFPAVKELQAETELLAKTAEATTGLLHATMVFWAIFFNVSLIMFISALLCSCKTYVYDRKNIVVYAGYFHHHLKVNGEKYDKHNTFIFFTPIVLSCTLADGAHFQATISLFNRIAFKIEDRLYTKKLQKLCKNRPLYPKTEQLAAPQTAWQYPYQR